MKSRTMRRLAVLVTGAAVAISLPVASSVAVKRKPPSPQAAITRRPGAATAAPIADGSANPSEAEAHGKREASGS